MATWKVTWSDVHNGDTIEVEDPETIVGIKDIAAGKARIYQLTKVGDADD